MPGNLLAIQQHGPDLGESGSGPGVQPRSLFLTSFSSDSEAWPGLGTRAGEEQLQKGFQQLINASDHST